MTAATAEPGVIVCPRCKGEGFLPLRLYPTCFDCKGSGTIPDPRIAIYYSSDPAAFVAACVQRPRDDERLRVWVQVCRVEGKRRIPRMDFPEAWTTDEIENVHSWILDNWLVDEFPLAVRCQLLRSVFPPPWLCGAAKCPAKVIPIYDDGEEYSHPDTCTCHGAGSILTPPEFDDVDENGEPKQSRWRSDTVLMVAAGIRGTYPCCEGVKRWADDETDKLLFGTCSIHGKTFPPHLEPERVEKLADALMDAGCDVDAILAHLHSGGPWVGVDWVLALILKK